jgi:small GTP-binding protein
MDDSDHKMVVLGNSGVGKTALVQRAATGTFLSSLSPTVGATTVFVRSPSRGRGQFQVWDTAGQEQFRDLVPIYFRNAACALVVFDLTSRESFRDVPDWVKRLRKVTPDAVLGLVGNKVDLTESRVVQFEQGEARARECGAAFYEETSALTGQGIDGIFSRLVDALGFAPAGDWGPATLVPEPVEDQGAVCC